MNNNNQNQIKKEGVFPKLARKIGEKSVNQTCVFWIHQPRVPESMKKSNKN